MKLSAKLVVAATVTALSLAGATPALAETSDLTDINTVAEATVEDIAGEAPAEGAEPTENPAVADDAAPQEGDAATSDAEAPAVAPFAAQPSQSFEPIDEPEASSNIHSFGGGVNVKSLGYECVEPAEGENCIARVSYEVSMSSVLSSNKGENMSSYMVQVPYNAKNIDFRLIGTQNIIDAQANAFPRDAEPVGGLNIPLPIAPDDDAFLAARNKIQAVDGSYLGGVPTKNQLDVILANNLPLGSVVQAWPTSRYFKGEIPADESPNQIFRVNSPIERPTAVTVSYDLPVQKGVATTASLRAEGFWKCNGYDTRGSFDEGCQSLLEVRNAGDGYPSFASLTEGAYCTPTEDTGDWATIGEDVEPSGWQGYAAEFGLAKNVDFSYTAPKNEDFCDFVNMEVVCPEAEEIPEQPAEPVVNEPKEATPVKLAATGNGVDTGFASLAALTLLLAGGAALTAGRLRRKVTAE